MANILDENFNYDYNGTLLTEIFYKPTVGTPQLGDLMRIIPGSQFRIQATLSNPISKIVKVGKGCGRTETGDGFELTNQTIELDPMKMFVTECAEDFEGQLGNWIAEEALRSGIDRNDISGTQLETIIDTLLQDALRRDTFRIASFGDKTSGSTDYDQTDGLWTKLIADSGEGLSYCVQKGADISGSLADGDALAALKAVYQGSSNILDQIPVNQKYFAVTRSVYDNLVSSYESVSTGSDLQVSYQTDGIPNVMYRGVEIKKVASWDTDLADTANPLNGAVENLILYTTAENHVLGVGDTADLNRIEGWYSKDDDLYKFDSKMRFGYNYLHCDLSTIAF